MGIVNSNGSTNLVNPGSVWQTSDGKGNLTSYGAPPPNLYSGVGAAVATPQIQSGVPGTPQVNQGSQVNPNNFTDLNKNTAFVDTPTGIMQNTKGIYDFKMPAVIPAKALTNEASNEASKVINQAQVLAKESQNVENVHNLKYKPLIDAFAKNQVVPTQKANDAYVNALYKDLTTRQGAVRNATPEELKKFTSMSVKDASNLILGKDSPFFPKNIPGANPEIPDTQNPPADEVNDGNNNLDPVKMIQATQKIIDDISSLIAQERESYDNTKVELGNRLGSVMPVVQGLQAYVQSKEDIRLNRLVEEKKNAIESGNLQLKAYDYSRQLRKDQQESLATIIDMNLKNGVPINKSVSEQYAKLTGMDAQFIEDSFAVAAQNYIKNKNQELDTKMLASGYAYIPTPKALTEAKKNGEVIELGGRSYQKVGGDKTTFGKIGTDELGNDIMGFIDTTNQTTKQASESVKQNGQIGGQCGDYAHSIMNGTPKFGDTIESKRAAMNVKPEQFASNPQVGDILTFSTSAPTGHVAVVTAVNGDKVTLSESNFNLDEKVTNGRQISVNDKNILGAFRGATFKSGTPPSNKGKFTPEFYASPIGQKTLNNEQQYYTNFLGNAIVKDFSSVQNKAASVKKIVDMGVGGPGDLALVFEFMKALDPTSVVRNEEYDNAAASGNIFAGWAARFNGYLSINGGFLPENVKTSFVDIIGKKLEVQQAQYNQLRDSLGKIAEEQGLNPEHVAPDITVDFKLGSAAQKLPALNQTFESLDGLLETLQKSQGQAVTDQYLNKIEEMQADGLSDLQILQILNK